MTLTAGKRLEVASPHLRKEAARFFGHIDTCGDDLIRKARTLVASEIADELWN